MVKRAFIPVLLLTISLGIHQSHAQFDTGYVTVQAVPSAEKIPAGKSFKLAILLDIKPGFHINSDQPLDESLIPTKVSFEPIDGVSFGRVYYPQPVFKKFDFSERELAVYENSVKIFTEVTVKKDFKPGKIVLKGTLSYQACNDHNCFLPQSVPFEVPVEIVPAGQNLIPANQELFTDFPALSAGTEAKTAGAEGMTFTREEQRAKEIIDKGFFYALFAFFLFGLALNLTPCVYPVIPITVSYFGGQADKEKGPAFLRALVYVVGISIVFSLLGLISGLAGKQWGFLFQNPWFVVVVTVIILAMAASMFGAFEITVPQSVMNKFGRAREGVVGSFIMGLTVGVVIAPCAAGIIIGLVGLVAKLGIVLKGTVLFFVMGLGLGLPYLFLATFSNLLNKLPQSGMWMVWIKKFFGILLVGVAIYFFLPQASHINDQLGFYMGTLAIFGGLLLGFLDHAPGYTEGFKRFRAVFGVLAILLGIYLTNHAVHSKPSAIAWEHYAGETVEQLTSGDKPVFMDFYADWCAPCKEMDHTTFKDPAVVELSKKFRMIKVDCTAPDATTRAFMEKFGVTGMPTLIFLRPDGKELTRLRFVGYLGPEDFARYMRQALQASGKEE